MIPPSTRRLVKRFTFGVNRYRQKEFPADRESLDKVNRVKQGIDFPQFFAQLIRLNVDSQRNFGGVQNAPSIAWEQRWIFFRHEHSLHASPTTSRRLPGSTIFGRRASSSSGTSRNAVACLSRLLVSPARRTRQKHENNPLDTNYALSNARFGCVEQLSGIRQPLSHARPPTTTSSGSCRITGRITKRLTLDLGVRFYHIDSTTSRAASSPPSSPGLYDPGKAAKLIQPYRPTPIRRAPGPHPAERRNRARRADRNARPRSGTFFQGHAGLHESIMHGPALIAAPRVGFAYDVFGNGKTAVRAASGFSPSRSGRSDRDCISYRPRCSSIASCSTPPSAPSVVADLLACPHRQYRWACNTASICRPPTT